MKEEFLGEKYVQEEKSLVEKNLNEQYVQEQFLGEKYVQEGFLGEESLVKRKCKKGEVSLGETYIKKYVQEEFVW